MPVKKYCSYTGCRVLLPEDVQYCEKHAKVKQQDNRRRNRKYKQQRNDQKEQHFYKSEQWERCRQSAIVFYFGMDIYEYYTTGRIAEGYTAHHIVELKEDWSKALDVNNIIYLTESNHQLIHEKYKKSKKQVQRLLYDMILRFYEEFRVGV
ncbi:hypothetical protein [Eubacterium callanderi]|uniref:hypothetical protein n=1 Tax=Eubacterium callanderi TaxID=53442 RepID=UPI0039931398